MKKIITPSPKSSYKGRRLTPIDIAWQRAVTDSLIMTPEEEEERNKRLADIKKRKDKMYQLRKEVEEMDNEVANMVKEMNRNGNNYALSNASVKDIYDEMVKMQSESEKKDMKQGKTIFELDELSDDESILGDILHISKNELNLKQCDGVSKNGDKTEHNSKLVSAEDHFNKSHNGDSNSSENGSVMFLKVVSNDAFFVGTEDKYQSESSKIKVVSPKSKEKSSSSSSIDDVNLKENTKQTESKLSILNIDMSRTNMDNNNCNHLNSNDEKDIDVGSSIQNERKKMKMNTSNNSKITNEDTSSVNSDNIQASFVPMTSIDIQSSASHESELTNGTFCLPIDKKADEEKEIIKKLRKQLNQPLK